MSNLAIHLWFWTKLTLSFGLGYPEPVHFFKKKKWKFNKIIFFENIFHKNFHKNKIKNSMLRDPNLVFLYIYYLEAILMNFGGFLHHDGTHTSVGASSSKGFHLGSLIGFFLQQQVLRWGWLGIGNCWTMHGWTCLHLLAHFVDS